MDVYENKGSQKSTVFFIGKEKFTTENPQLTVREVLMNFAKADPATTILARREGNGTHKFSDLNEVITIKNGDHFVVLYSEPTPVS